MILNDASKIVAKCWNELSKHYPNIILDEFCIMPNHVHFIVGVDNSVFLANFIENSSTKNSNTTLNSEINIHGVFEFIKSFKSFSSRKINEMNKILEFRVGIFGFLTLLFEMKMNIIVLKFIFGTIQKLGKKTNMTVKVEFFYFELFLLSI